VDTTRISNAGHGFLNCFQFPVADRDDAAARAAQSGS
jgi:hypothetical protein